MSENPTIDLTLEPEYPSSGSTSSSASKESDKTGREVVQILTQINRTLGQPQASTARSAANPERAEQRFNLPPAPIETKGGFQSPFGGGFISKQTAQEMYDRRNAAILSTGLQPLEQSSSPTVHGLGPDPASYIDKQTPKEIRAEAARMVASIGGIPESQGEDFSHYEKIRQDWEQIADRNEGPRLFRGMKEERRVARERDFDRFDIGEQPDLTDLAESERTIGRKRPGFLSRFMGSGKPPVPPETGEGGAEGEEGGGGRGRYAPLIASRLGSMVGGRLGGGIGAGAGAGFEMAGAGGAVLGGLGAIAGTALTYEAMPFISAWLARREQFRSEFVESEAMAARARAQRGQGLPEFTMFGQQGIFEEPKQEIPKPDVSTAKAQGELIQRRLTYLRAQKSELQKSLSSVWAGVNRNRELEQQQLVTLSEEETDLMSRLRTLPVGQARGTPFEGGKGGGGEPSPERNSPDRLYPKEEPTHFEPEDMPYGEVSGLNLAPLVASLRAHGLSTTESPKLPPGLMKFHRERTQAERDHPGADERDKRLYNTPRHDNVGYMIEREHEAFKKFFLDGGVGKGGGFQKQPFESLPGTAIASAEPIYRMVASPYGGMCA